VDKGREQITTGDFGRDDITSKRGVKLKIVLVVCPQKHNSGFTETV
jgi:hypothetical protein